MQIGCIFHAETLLHFKTEKIVSYERIVHTLRLQGMMPGGAIAEAVPPLISAGASNHSSRDFFMQERRPPPLNGTTRSDRKLRILLEAADQPHEVT